MTTQTFNAAPDADIVVGVDGSDESFAALRWAMRESALSGRRVNAVYGWTRSWDMGAEPDSEEGWERVRHDIAAQLRRWVDEASEGVDFDPADLTLTSVKASGTAALLQIGRDARQIVVGRRSLGPVARWFLGSLSASLAESAEVPVTVVRLAGGEEETVTNDIANALSPVEEKVYYLPSEGVVEESRRPVVVGVDGSDISRRALAFAAEEARLHDAPLQVLFCWQLKDLGSVPGYERAVAPIEVGQRRAEEMLAGVLAEASLPEGLEVGSHAFHISASKGLVAASRYASHLVVGSRGLSGLDAHFLGSVSRQIVNFAECTVTVVH
ncbi:universal stress protein [Bifidobacterium sp. CP2]|uniref:universal stress protein n=1 Tax=Bifidobacterium sp. CP2 TaxID=2809025 RepID=UPI001BDD8DFC|nr:universal stress protein [Bifidobacterium sp. CP2]MBT1180440.1 universal stress protein [Bifidobacterium sp. CP2]